MKTPSLLVFGADGQLGHAFAARKATPQISLHLRTFAEADIADPSAVVQAIAETQPSVIVNAAAYTNVDQAEDERDQAFRANALGPETLAQICAEKKLPLVHISTDYVFDGAKKGAYVESDRPAPLGVYGHSKLAGEIAVAKTRQHLILRTSWLFSAYEKNFLKTILRLAGERDELRIVADQHGCPTSTADLVDAIVTASPRLAADEPIWGLYHLASPHATTWHGFASEIVDAQAKFTGKRPTVKAIASADYPTKAARPLNSELNSSKFFDIFGFRATDWRQRTRDAVAQLCDQTKTGMS